MGLRLTNMDESPHGLSFRAQRGICFASSVLHSKKQILRFLESDAPLRAGLGGLHRSPKIGLRRFAAQNDRGWWTLAGEQRRVRFWLRPKAALY
jgi:hypothetical protein